MNKEELIQKQNEIDERIKQIWGENCSLDGITDIDSYLNSYLKEKSAVVENMSTIDIQVFYVSLKAGFFRKVVIIFRNSDFRKNVDKNLCAVAQTWVMYVFILERKNI